MPPVVEGWPRPCADADADAYADADADADAAVPPPPPPPLRIQWPAPAPGLVPRLRSADDMRRWRIDRTTIHERKRGIARGGMFTICRLLRSSSFKSSPCAGHLREGRARIGAARREHSNLVGV